MARTTHTRRSGRRRTDRQKLTELRNLNMKLLAEVEENAERAKKLESELAETLSRMQVIRDDTRELMHELAHCKGRFKGEHDLNGVLERALRSLTSYVNHGTRGRSHELSIYDMRGDEKQAYQTRLEAFVKSGTLPPRREWYGKSPVETAAIHHHTHALANPPVVGDWGTPGNEIMDAERPE